MQGRTGLRQCGSVREKGRHGTNGRNVSQFCRSRVGQCIKMHVRGPFLTQCCSRATAETKEPLTPLLLGILVIPKTDGLIACWERWMPISLSELFPSLAISSTLKLVSLMYLSSHGCIPFPFFLKSAVRINLFTISLLRRFVQSLTYITSEGLN